MWGPGVEEPTSGGIGLKIRTPGGAVMMRSFAPSNTLRDVLASVHAAGHRLDPTRQYKLAMQFGPTVTDHEATLEAAGVQRGAYTLSEC